MLLILPPATSPLWLGEDAAEPEQLKGVLQPYPADDMTGWPALCALEDVFNCFCAASGAKP